MNPSPSPSCTAFDGTRRVAAGTLAEVALRAKQALEAGAAGPLLIFDDQSSRQLEIDFCGSADQVLARLAPVDSGLSAARGPGRPRLGVVAREVTLLPRHWDWLGSQPGGASAVLRRLVEQSLRGCAAPERARQAVESTDRFMLVMAGDLPGYEEASRAFYRGDRARFAALTLAWPVDVRDHLRQLAARAWDEQADAR